MQATSNIASVDAGSAAHPDDRDGGQHDGRLPGELQRREEAVGEGEDHDRADATNEINHTAHVHGDGVARTPGAGYQPVGAGVDCNITLTAVERRGADPAGPLNTVTNANGQCSITFTSATPGRWPGTASRRCRSAVGR